MKEESKKEEKIEALEEYCPNCWGYQEYQGKMYDAAKKEDIDLKNIKKARGWIQAYAAKHFHAFKMEKRNGVDTCPACVDS